MNSRLGHSLIVCFAVLIIGAPSGFADTDPFPGVADGAEVSAHQLINPRTGDPLDGSAAIACPTGSGRSQVANATTGEQYLVCVKNWRPTSEINADKEFRDRQIAATAVAEAESKAWNAANPGKQKCVQWGPIVHANGISTASGGVCANPVEPGPTTTVQTQSAESVVGPTSSTTGSSSVNSTSDSSISTTSQFNNSTQSMGSVTTSTTVPAPTGSTVNPNVPGSGAPFTRVLSGQLSTAECPVGFQGANGIIVAIGIGTFTECWPKNAWDAWRLGGTYWELYKSSGGTYDIQAVITRLTEISNFKAQAKSIAQKAADLTPGIQRCSTWSAYGETGQECAYTFINPTGNSANTSSSIADSSTTTSSTTTFSIPNKSESSTLVAMSDTSSVTSDSSTVSIARALNLAATGSSTTSASTPNVSLQKVEIEGTISQIKSLVEKIEPSKKDVSTISDLMNKLESTKVVTRNQKAVNLPKSPSIDESAKSLTPDICVVNGMSVSSLKKGQCSIEYKVVDSVGNVYTTIKYLEFKK